MTGDTAIAITERGMVRITAGAVGRTERPATTIAATGTAVEAATSGISRAEIRRRTAVFFADTDTPRGAALAITALLRGVATLVATGRAGAAVVGIAAAGAGAGGTTGRPADGETGGTALTGAVALSGWAARSPTVRETGIAAETVEALTGGTAGAVAHLLAGGAVGFGQRWKRGLGADLAGVGVADGPPNGNSAAETEQTLEHRTPGHS
ncbi:MAG: hypothetical protein AB7G88_06240 [Thermomicrobiales bacterium]